MIERVAEVRLDHRDYGRQEAVLARLAERIEVAGADVVVQEDGVVLVHRDADRLETLDEQLLVMEDVAEVRLQDGAVEAGERESVAGLLVVVRREFEDDAEVADRRVGALEFLEGGVDLQGIEGQPEADRHVAVEERLLDAEGFAVGVDAEGVAAEMLEDGLIDAVEVVEIDVDTVDGSGAFVLGDFEAADGGEEDQGLGAPRRAAAEGGGGCSQAAAKLIAVQGHVGHGAAADVGAELGALRGARHEGTSRCPPHALRGRLARPTRVLGTGCRAATGRGCGTAGAGRAAADLDHLGVRRVGRAPAECQGKHAASHCFEESHPTLLVNFRWKREVRPGGRFAGTEPRKR